MNRRPDISVVFVLAAVLCPAFTVSAADKVRCLNDPNDVPNAPLAPTLRLGKMTMQFQPTKPWCVPANTDVSFPVKLTGNNDLVLDDPNDILVYEKEPGGGWAIRGKYNLTDKRVHLSFTGDLTEGEDYGYEIRVRDVGVLDPTGRIINTSAVEGYVDVLLREMALQVGVPILPLQFVREADSAD